VLVWDLGSREALLAFNLSASDPYRLWSKGFHGYSYLVPWSKLPGIDFSPDSTHLAVELDELLVFDLRERAAIGFCRACARPHFRNGGRVLTALDRRGLFSPPSRVRVIEVPGDLSSGAGEGLAPDSELAVPPGGWSIPEREVYLGMTASAVVTAERAGGSKFPWPDWTPVAVREWVSSLWGANALTHRIRVRDSANGSELQATTVLMVSADPNSLQSQPQPPVTSEDGRFLIIPDETQLALWFIPGEHPLSCHLTCSALALLAAYLAWPRKGKTAGVAAAR
jgi:hypothetical protein